MVIILASLLRLLVYNSDDSSPSWQVLNLLNWNFKAEPNSKLAPKIIMVKLKSFYAEPIQGSINPSNNVVLQSDGLPVQSGDTFLKLSPTSSMSQFFTLALPNPFPIRSTCFYIVYYMSYRLWCHILYNIYDI